VVLVTTRATHTHRWKLHNRLIVRGRRLLERNGFIACRAINQVAPRSSFVGTHVHREWCSRISVGTRPKHQCAVLESPSIAPLFSRNVCPRCDIAAASNFACSCSGARRNKINEAFNYVSRQSHNIDLLLPLDALLHQVIDVTVQAALR
jgi:hypothetical protein